MNIEQMTTSLNELETELKSRFTTKGYCINSSSEECCGTCQWWKRTGPTCGICEYLNNRIDVPEWSWSTANDLRNENGKCQCYENAEPFDELACEAKEQYMALINLRRKVGI